ncbi:hypothetical protein Tco_1458182 [Tanacetum coccineum]
MNANPIRYALTINPTIYTSCIEQFWATVKAKTVNGELQLESLVDGKKIIITEATTRRDLQLEDAEGIDYLPNATIFEQLSFMGAKTTAWNEFSSTMASLIICLATNQKFNFSKYIFKSMVKNLDNADKFLMYPRFVQVFLDKQLEGMSTHKRIYVTPSHTKKIFGNMKRVGKGFSGRVTPLFPTMVVQDQEEMGEGSAIPTDPHHIPIIIESTSQPLNKQRSRRPKKKDTQIPQSSVPGDNVADEDVNEKMDDSLVRATTTASGLEAEQDSVLALENTKTAQAQEITSLKLNVKKLEKKGGSRTHKLKILYKVGRSARMVSSNEASLGDQEDASKQERKIDDIDKDAKITSVDETQGRYGDDIMFDVSDLVGKEVFVAEQGVPDSKKDPSESITTTPTLTTTTAATTITAVNTRPKAKGLVIHEEEQATTPTVSSQQPSQVKALDKGKWIMVEEPVKMKKKDQISLDEELAFKLQAEEEEEERLAREKAQQIKEANIVAWDNKSKLFVQLLEARKKHFAVIRAQEERNKPPNKAQKRNTMSTYLKNMAGYKHNQLKNNNFDDIQKLFDKAMKKVNTFVDMDTELVEGSEVRAEGSEIRVEGSSKRGGWEVGGEQKLEEDKETTELQRLIEVVPDKEEVAIDAIPLATKPPSIVDYKIHKEGKKTYYQISRADGSSKMYLVFSHMLKSFDSEDLETLWKLVKAKHGSTRPKDGINIGCYGVI